MNSIDNNRQGSDIGGNVLLRLFAVVRNFSANRQGNIAIMAAFLMLPMVMAIGVAVDYSSLSLARSNLQQLADNSALAAAREMALISKKTGSADAVVRNFIRSHLASVKSKLARIDDIKVIPDPQNNFLEVVLLASKKNAFGNFLQPEYSTITVTAKAKALGSVNICAIGLDTRSKDTITLDGNAILIANACGVYSNSAHSKSINFLGNSNLQAGLVCSSGGVKKSKGSQSPEAVTDCPPIENPLRDRASLNPGNCDHNDFKVSDKVKLLWPGTYCGGLKIEGKSTVRFFPGIYVIKDGLLEIAGTSVVNGTYTGFYFTGDNARLKFEKETTISFVAPKRGAMAGMLFFQDPTSPEPPNDNEGRDDGKFEIRSNNARTLLGTIYLPKGVLKIDSQNPVADESAFTVVIAKRMQFFGDSRLVLNSDYAATDVPVPDGIAGEGNKVYLTN